MKNLIELLNLRSISEIQLELWHSPDNRCGYSSVMDCLQKHLKKMLEQGKTEHTKTLNLLAREASIMLGRQVALSKPAFKTFR